MSTNYDYVDAEDPQFPAARAQIEEFYRKIHAANYEDPNDAQLAAMWLLTGSLLFRGNMYKKVIVFSDQDIYIGITWEAKEVRIVPKE